MKRWLEIQQDGVAFHETDFAGNTPPAEVFYCDCEGVGKHTYNSECPTYLVYMHNQTPAKDAEGWKRQHTGPKCAIRRQIFVDVTHLPEAQLGMVYDEQAHTFSRKA